VTGVPDPDPGSFGGFYPAWERELPAHPLAREGVDESGETEHVCLLACPALAVRLVSREVVEIWGGLPGWKSQ